MERKAEIRTHTKRTHYFFGGILTDEKDKLWHTALKCAFDKDKDCSPDCAACSITATKDSAYVGINDVTCNRGNFLIAILEI